jgi:hypothetical protein
VIHLPADWTQVQIINLGKINNYFTGERAKVPALTNFDLKEGTAIFDIEPFSIYQIVKY